MRVTSRLRTLFAGTRLPDIRGRLKKPIAAARRLRKRSWEIGRRVFAVVLPWALAIGGSLLIRRWILEIPIPKLIAGVAALFVAALIAWRLELGIILVIIVGASFIYPPAIPKPVTLGGQGLYVTELLIFMMVVMTFAKCCVERKFDFFKSPLTIPLVLLGTATVMAIVVSYVRHMENPVGPWPFKDVYNAARPVFHYLLFFVIAFGLRTEQQLGWILKALIWIAVAVSILMVIQYFVGTGVSLFLGGRMAGLAYVKRLSPNEEEVTRTMPPGLAPILIFFLVCVAKTAYESFRKASVSLVASGIIGMGTVFTFTRNYWVVSLLGVMVIFALCGSRARRKMAGFIPAVVLSAVLGSILIGHLAPGEAGRNFLPALQNRFMSTFEGGYKYNPALMDRRNENRMALKHIARSPIFGIGLGHPVLYKWRRFPAPYGTVFYPVNAIHNSYLELWVGYGLLGLVSFLWLSAVFLARCVVLFFRLRDPTWKAVLLGFFAAYMGFLIRAGVGMVVVGEVFNIMMAAVMWGVVEYLWLNMPREVKQADVVPVVSAAQASAVGA